MTMLETIEERIRTERNNGATHDEIAKKYGVSTSYITNLLNGKRTYEGITLGTFSRMFPRATISLDGSPGTNVQTVGDHSPGVMQANGPITSAPSTASDAEALRARITSALIRADLPADVLKSVLTIVQDTK